MCERTDVLIIGSGPTGLGAAWRIAQAYSCDWRLFEAEGTPGGLAGSTKDPDGFIWDFGGHVHFSHYPYYDRLMDNLLGADGWTCHKREAWVRLQGEFVPYPLQLNLHHLPGNLKGLCVAGLEELRDGEPPPRHFGEWINRCFGSGIAETFLRPYNLKVWGYPLEELGWRWTGDRVPKIDMNRLMERLGPNQEQIAWGPNHRFRFPLRGGSGAVWSALAHQLARPDQNRFQMQCRLTSLDSSGRLASFSDGSRVRYKYLLSTIPLDVLVRSSDLVGTLGSELVELKHSSTHVLGIALRGQLLEPLLGKSWVYFPESNCSFHRATMFSSYSPFNVPDHDLYSSIMLEVTESPYKSVDRATLGPETVRALADMGFIREDSVHHVWHRRLEYGYPIPSLHRDRALHHIMPELEARGVYSRGRFGAWKYEVSNQDHCFAQGVEIVDRLFGGGIELTVNHPEIVNRN